MVEDEEVKETDLYIGEIADDFGYRWIFVKPRPTEIKEYFTLSTMYRGKPVYGWVRKFPNWEDRKKEVESFVRDHEARAGVEAFHTIWSMKTLISKYGPVATIRELKLRCDAGAIVGCSMYLNFSQHLIETALKFKDPAMQAPSLDFLEAAEGDKWVKRIEEIHAEYPDRRVPKNVIGDLQDEFRDDLERRVGRIIPRLPADATQEDIMQSKKIGEQLARGAFIRKPEEKPKPPPAVAPLEPIPVEKLPETKPELELMRKEIKERIEEEKKRRGRGGKIAGEPSSDYPEKKYKSREYLSGRAADGYSMGDERNKVKYLEGLFAFTFTARQGREPDAAEMQVMKLRVESLIRKYGTYTYKELENAINASLSIEDLENMVLAIHASNLTFDDKKKLIAMAAERRRIFKGEVVGEAFMKQAGFELKEDCLTDREIDMVAEKISKLSREERVKIARGIIATMGQTEEKTEEVIESVYKKVIDIEKERGEIQQISLDDIAKLPKEKRLALARKIAAGDTEIIREVQDLYSGWTYDDFRFIINRITSIEDLTDLAKHISESRATTPEERIELRNLVVQREREIRIGGPEIKKQIEEQQRALMLASVERLGEDEVREEDDLPVEPEDYTQWTFSDFETFIPSLDSIDELEELYEYVGASDKVTEQEGDILREMIDKRIEKIRGS